MKITGNASASAPKTGGRLAGKDFINIGIFTAIYFVVVFAVACLGFIPILMAAICGIVPLFAGIPYMLFLTRAILSHGIFSCWIIGNFLPFLLTANTYLPTVRAQYGDAYVDELMTYLQPELYPVLLAACFVTGVVGGFIGRAILKKHFKRAGIA